MCTAVFFIIAKNWWQPTWQNKDTSFNELQYISTNVQPSVIKSNAAEDYGLPWKYVHALLV